MSPHLEHPPNPELDHHLVEAYTSVFFQRRDCYPVQLPNGTYYSRKKSLTLDIVRKHLLGSITIGTYMLSLDNNTSLLCFDADDQEEWQGVIKMAKKLQVEGIPTYLERSRRGGHCWLFTPVLSGRTVRCFARQLLINYDAPLMEIYPKQTQLRTGTGSLVRLPLGIHLKTGKRYPFIHPTGEPIAPTMRQQLALLSAPHRTSQSFIEFILAQIPPQPPLSTKIFADLPRPTGNTLSERIKSRISVFDFVRRYVMLDSKGMGFCPFHDDEHKSFGVNQTRNFWHCYAGCGGGSVIDFWIKWREIHGQDTSFTATLRELAGMLL